MNFKDSLQKAGYTGRVFTYWMPWFGEPGKVHRQNRYLSASQATINSQLDIMKDCGIDGVIAIWQGYRNPTNHDAFMKMFLGCLNKGMNFLMMFDQWVAKDLPDPTGTVITTLQSPFFQAIFPFFCEKWVLEFDLGPSANVDMVKVRAAFPNITFLSKHTGYSWPETSNTIASLKQDNSNPSTKIAGLTLQFNDGGYPLPGGVDDPAHFIGNRDYNKSVWNGTKAARVLDQQAGFFYFDQLAVTPKWIDVGLVTWNDWDEGTAIEGFCSMSSGIAIKT